MLQITQIEQPLNSITFAINSIKSKPANEQKALEGELMSNLQRLEALILGIRLSEKTPIEEAKAALPIVYYYQEIFGFYYELLKQNPSVGKGLLEQYWKMLDALENLELALDTLADAETRKDLSDAAKGNYSNFTTYDPQKYKDLCTE